MKLILLIIMLKILLLFSAAARLASGTSCVDTCADPTYCLPITKPLPERETLLFTTLTSGDSWKEYDYSKVTTLAIFGSNDDETVADLVCFAHAKNVRVVKGAEFPMDRCEVERRALDSSLRHHQYLPPLQLVLLVASKWSDAL